MTDLICRSKWSRWQRSETASPIRGRVAAMQQDVGRGAVSSTPVVVSCSYHLLLSTLEVILWISQGRSLIVISKSIALLQRHKNFVYNSSIASVSGPWCPWSTNFLRIKRKSLKQKSIKAKFCHSESASLSLRAGMSPAILNFLFLYSMQDFIIHSTDLHAVQLWWGPLGVSDSKSYTNYVYLRRSERRSERQKLLDAVGKSF